MAALDALSSNILPGEPVAPTDLPTSGALPTPMFFPVSGPKGSKGTLDATNSADILAKMEKFIQERSQPKQPSLLGGVGDALASASMSLYHPEAYVQQEKNKSDLEQQKAKDVLDMQMQIAQYKSAQELQKQRNKAFEMYGTQPNATATSGNSAPTSTAPGSAFTPDILKHAAFLRSQGPEGEAEALKYLTKVSEDYNSERNKKLFTVTGNEIVTIHGPNGTVYTPTREQAPALLKQLYPNGMVPEGAVSDTTPATKPSAPTAIVPTTNPEDIKASIPAKAPAAPIQATTTQGGYRGVAADVNNPVGIKGQDGFVRYASPQEGVQAATDLNAKYVRGEGPMKGIPPTVENMTGVWASGNPAKQPPGYVPFVKQELAKAGVKLNPDSTVPNTPEAVNALTAARIKFESGKNASKFLPYVGQAPAQAVTTAPTQAATTAPTQAATTAPTQAAPVVSSGTKGQIQAVIDLIKKPHPQASQEEWATYNKTIAELTSKMAMAPIEAQQAAGKTTTVARAVNSAANEKAMSEAANMYATSYKTPLDQMEALANDKKNEHLFAIGNKQNDDVTKAMALGKQLGLDPETMKQTYISYNPNISNEDRSKMDQFDKNSKQIVAAYVHQTFPGRILASELSLGAGAKGIGLDTQRMSNAASLASVRTIFELNQKLQEGLAQYRAKNGQDALFDDYVASPEGKQIIKDSADSLAKKFPEYFPRADKFAKHKVGANNG